MRAEKKMPQTEPPCGRKRHHGKLMTKLVEQCLVGCGQSANGTPSFRPRATFIVTTSDGRRLLTRTWLPKDHTKRASHEEWFRSSTIVIPSQQGHRLYKRTMGIKRRKRQKDSTSSEAKTSDSKGCIFKCLFSHEKVKARSKSHTLFGPTAKTKPRCHTPTELLLAPRPSQLRTHLSTPISLKPLTPSIPIILRATLRARLATLTNTIHNHSHPPMPRPNRNFQRSPCLIQLHLQVSSRLRNPHRAMQLLHLPLVHRKSHRVLKAHLQKSVRCFSSQNLTSIYSIDSEEHDVCFR